MALSLRGGAARTVYRNAAVPSSRGVCGRGEHARGQAGGRNETFDPLSGKVYAGPVTRLVSATLPLLLTTVGCTLVLDPGEPQCQTAMDCTARGFANATCESNVCVVAHQCETAMDCAALGLMGDVCTNNVCVDPVWGCLGNVVEATPDPTKKVTITEQLTDTAQAPVTNATVDVCAKLDTTCMMTDPNYPKGLTPDASGSVTFTVIQGFDGFVRITAPNFVDSRVFVGRPVVAPPAVKSVRLIQTSEYSILAGTAKLTPDPTRGTAILYAVDCSGLAASGVSFSVSTGDSMSALFYLINQFPTLPPSAMATDVDGFGGDFNLPTGPAVVTTNLVSKQEYIGQSSFTVLANTISYVQIAPTPM
jgi:hypothetical protein